MAKLKTDDIQHVAKLSKLELTSEEIEKFTPQLESIIEFVGQLQEVSTDEVKPTSQTTGLVNVFRDDVIDSSNTLMVNDYFKVDKILKNRTDK